jgi:hypothetical protein
VGNASTERGGYSKDRSMKKLGMILLALYLIVDSLLGFGLNLGPLIFLVYLIGLAAGILILIGAMKSSG